MFTIDKELLLQSAAQALDTMAYIAIEPFEGSVPTDSICVTLSFNGTLNGEFVLRAPLALGAVIAANLTASDPAAPVPFAEAADALRELVNVAAGLVLRDLYPDSQAPHLDVPAIRNAAPTGTLESVPMMAEGHPLLFGMSVCV